MRTGIVWTRGGGGAQSPLKKQVWRSGHLPHEVDRSVTDPMVHVVIRESVNKQKC